MNKRVFLCKSHPDFHIPADVDVGEGFDGPAYAKRLKECGVDAVAFFAKCHYGHCYYDTKIGYKHPRLKKDMLAEVVRGCRKHGLGVIAYFSVFLDTAAVEHHPAWRLKASDTSTNAGFDSGNYLPVCVNSGYAGELFIPQSAEVAKNYDVDELFFDTMTGFNPCFCEACKKSFGRPIPLSDKDGNWLEYVAWYASCYARFYAATAEAVHRANPAVGTAFNWEWGVRTPKSPPPHITRISADLIPTGTVASELAHYFAGTGYPFDYMCGRFLSGLGDWTSNTPETIKYTASATIANGGSFYIIDRQLPDGRLEERAYEMMRDVFGFVQERRDVVENTVHVPETAVLHSYDALMGDRLQFFPAYDARKQRIEPFSGVSRMFMHGAHHYTALSAENLIKRMGEYRLAILPETEFLDAKTCVSLERYVKEGGSLLVTQSASPAGLCPEMLKLAGVEHEGFSELDYGYFERPAGEPIAVRGKFSRVRPVGDAREIVRNISPLSAGMGGKKFGHGFAPADKYEGFALATERRVGKGAVIYVAMPAFKHYWQHQNPFVAALVFGLIDRLLPDPLVRVPTKAQMEMVALRKGDDLIVHLVNHSGRERLGGYWSPLTEYMPEIRDIPVAIRAWRTTAVAGEIFLMPSKQPVDYRAEDGYLKLTVPRLEFMESILAKGYYAKK
ncbi:MAG: alpha-L-fucosidase [Planctomycetes bacterium]|nr:alpha-L-fucosidase [Planctomycetota bacterium]